MTMLNKTLMTVTLSVIIFSLSAHAVKSTPNIEGQGIRHLQKVNVMSNNNPSFSIYNLKNVYQLSEGKENIEFIMDSEQFISYYIYITDSTNIIYQETNGFINSGPTNINFRIQDMNSGDYEMVIEGHDNNKNSTQKRFDIKLNS